MNTAMKPVAAPAGGRWMPLLAILLLLAASTAYARGETPASKQAPSYHTDLNQTVQTALQTEKKNLASIQKSLQDHQQRSRDLIDQISLYTIQISTIGNLLLAPGTRIDDLEKASLGIRTAIEKLDGSQAELKERLDAVQKLAQQLTEQKASAGQQLEALKTDKRHTPETQALIDDLNALIRSQTQQGAMLGKVQTDYVDLIARVGETLQGFMDLTQKFSLGIQEKKRADLFQRTVNPLISLGWKNIGAELRLLAEQIRKIVSLEYWLALGTDLLASRGLLPVSALTLYLLTLMLTMRLRRFCRRLKDTPFGAEYPWRRMAIRLLTRSMPQLGTALFFYIFFQARGFFATVPGIQETFSLLIVWLFTKWGLNFITLQTQQDPQLLPTAWVPRLKRLLRLIRYFAAVYLALAWMLGSGGVLLMVVRIAFEAALVVWIVRFRPEFSAHPMPAVAPEVWQRLLLRHSRRWPTLFSSPAWCSSWLATVRCRCIGSPPGGKIAAALFLGLLFFLVLRECGQRFYKGPHTPSAAPIRTAEPIRWAVFQLCWLLWGVVLVVTMVLAWSGTQAVFSGLLTFCAFPSVSVLPASP